MINKELLNKRIKQFDDGQKASEMSRLLWKPKEGLQKVRVVPYKFNPESPFIELQFYYNLAGGHYLAPCTFGKPDPVAEVVETCRANGNQELATKLVPSTRTYVPIIVRGEEDLGVRFWGFGVTVYKQLLKLMVDPDWGDITSLVDGNDINVEFKKISGKKNLKTGLAFPETNITGVPKKSPAVDPSRKDLIEKINSQSNILDVFPLKSYDELKEIVFKWLNPEEQPQSPEGEPEASSLTETPDAVHTAVSGTPEANKKLAEEFAGFFDKKK